MRPKMDEMEFLKKLVGKRAFTALKRGSKLHIWRNTTPWNWWIETIRGEQLWHSDERGGRPNLQLFTKIEDCDGYVFSHGFSGDDGQPKHSKYQLKKQSRRGQCQSRRLNG